MTQSLPPKYPFPPALQRTKEDTCSYSLFYIVYYLRCFSYYNRGASWKSCSKEKDSITKIINIEKLTYFFFAPIINNL